MKQYFSNLKYFSIDIRKFLFKSSISNLISDTKKIGRRFAIDSQENRRIPRSIIRVQRRGRPKKHIQPPFASCFMQIQTQSFANQRENICIFLPWNTSSWKVFTKKNTSILPLKQTGYARVYIYMCVCVCKYHALFYHPPPRPDKERKNSSSVFTFIQVNIHVCSLYVIRSLDI